MRNTKYIKRLLFLIVFLQFMSCKKTNWDETFREKDTNPFGTYIISKEAKELLEADEVEYLKDNIYDYLYDNYNTTYADFGNYMCIKHSAYKITDDGVESLLSFVDDGNNAFMSLNYFNENLKERLEFTTNNLDIEVSSSKALAKLKGEFYLENSAFKEQSYKFDRNVRRHYFLEYNKKNTIVLGTMEIDGEKVPNFVKIYHGKGAIYLHSNPIAFTNYYLLKDRENYVENVFSYLPKTTLLWDPHIRSSKYSGNEEDKTSVFKFFFEHETLTWFLLVSLFGLLLFMLFNARRKQRAIPIINPLENTTVAFTQTISSLYLKENDHKNLVDKKIAFFLEKVRTKYLLNTAKLNPSFIKKLAAKSGNKLQNTKYLINTIIALNKKTECSEEELLVLHKMIENFFRK